MDGFDRIYDLHRLLKGRKTAISTQSIMGEMECSRATFNRIKRHMVDFLGAPIEYSREHGGYLYREDAESGFELPGLWFNEQELHALLLIQQLVTNLGVGLLKEELYPIESRINTLLDKSAINPEDIKHRVRFIGVAHRKVDPQRFGQLTRATLNGQRLKINYSTRLDAQTSIREISPQRLINYRNNWYLDAWCHTRNDLRTFAMECIATITDTNDTYKRISDQELDAYFQAGYGIFAGKNIEEAVVLFSHLISHRIQEEQWHPLQKLKVLDDGRLEMRLPINIDQPEEFIQDLLRLGSQVEISSPTSLQHKLVEELHCTLALYR